MLDLWQDPQERYDIFMTNFTESTWALVRCRCRRRPGSNDRRKP